MPNKELAPTLPLSTFIFVLKECFLLAIFLLNRGVYNE